MEERGLRGYIIAAFQQPEGNHQESGARHHLTEVRGERTMDNGYKLEWEVVCEFYFNYEDYEVLEQVAQINCEISFLGSFNLPVGQSSELPGQKSMLTLL